MHSSGRCRLPSAPPPSVAAPLPSGAAPPPLTSPTSRHFTEGFAPVCSQSGLLGSPNPSSAMARLSDAAPPPLTSQKEDMPCEHVRPSAEALSCPAAPLTAMDSSQAAIAAAPTTASAPLLEDCLCLLRGDRDEQKLAGLLIAANVCRASDAAAVALGPWFLRRLLNTDWHRPC